MVFKADFIWFVWMIFKVPENTFHEIYDLPLVSVDFIRRSTTHTRSWAGPMLKKDLVEQYLQAKPSCRVLQHHSDNVLLNRKHLGIHIVDTYVCKYIYLEHIVSIVDHDTYIYYCMKHYVDKCRVCVVDTEIFSWEPNLSTMWWLENLRQPSPSPGRTLKPQGAMATRLVFSCVFCEIMIVPTLRNFEFQLKDLLYLTYIFFLILGHSKKKTQITQKTIPLINLPQKNNDITTNHPMESPIEARAPGEVQLYGGGLGFEVQMVVMVVGDFGRFEKKTTYQPAWRCMFLMWVE